MQRTISNTEENEKKSLHERSQHNLSKDPFPEGLISKDRYTNDPTINKVKEELLTEIQLIQNTKQ